MSRLPLTRELRRALFNHELPRIAGEGTCPVVEGEIVEMSPHVALKVTKVNVRRGGGWSLLYELHDRRDLPRLLRRTPGIHQDDYEAIRDGFDEYGYPAEPTADAIAAAAEESSYTSVPSSLADAGEAVDARTQSSFTRQANENARHMELVNQARRERYELAQRLERAREDARLQGVDISSPLRVIERQLAVIEKRVYEGRAA